MITTKNRLLAQSSKAIEEGLDPSTKSAFDKIVEAGMKVALNSGLQGMLGGLEKRGDPVRDAAQGAVNLVLLLRMRATGRMPEQAMVPASYVLMLQALAFIEEAGIAEIDEETLTRATKVWTNTVFARSKISPAMLKQGAERVSSILNDPVKVEQLNLATGYSRDPRTPSHMEMPQARPAARPTKLTRSQRRRARRKGRK